MIYSRYRLLFLYKAPLFIYSIVLYLVQSGYANEKPQFSYYEVSQLKFSFGGMKDDLPDLDVLEDVELELSGKIITVAEFSGGIDKSLKLSHREQQEIAKLPVQ